MPTRRPYNGPLSPVLHPPACDACGRVMRYGGEVQGDETDEAEIRGWVMHWLCFGALKRRLRAARGLGAWLAWVARAETSRDA